MKALTCPRRTWRSFWPVAARCCLPAPPFVLIHPTLKPISPENRLAGGGEDEVDEGLGGARVGGVFGDGDGVFGGDVELSGDLDRAELGGDGGGDVGGVDDAGVGLA